MERAEREGGGKQMRKEKINVDGSLRGKRMAWNQQKEKKRAGNDGKGKQKLQTLKGLNLLSII